MGQSGAGKVDDCSRDFSFIADPALTRVDQLFERASAARVRGCHRHGDGKRAGANPQRHPPDGGLRPSGQSPLQTGDHTKTSTMHACFACMQHPLSTSVLATSYATWAVQADNHYPELTVFETLKVTVETGDWRCSPS